MGKGKSQTTTNSTTTAPDQQAGDAYRSILQQAAGVAGTPYQAYTGELTAPINSQQQAGIAGINANANYAQPFINNASGMIQNASQPLTASQIANYQNPYTQSVVNATQAQFNNQNAQQQQQLTGNAIASGAMGGNRAGVAAANLANQQNLAQAPVIAGLYNQGYQNALTTAQQQYQANPMSAAYQLGNLGVAGQNAALTGAGTQLGAGTLQQQTQQAADTANYNQYAQQQAYPFQTLQWLAGIDTAVGSQLGGTSSGQTTQPAPNSAAQWAGLGISALGLLSDRRAKEDIEHIGKMNDGQNIYRYRYKGSPEWHIGPIAQEVERSHPDSVSEGVAGLKFVDLKGATDDAARSHFDTGGGVAGKPWATAAGWVPTINPTGGSGAPRGNAPSPANNSSPAVDPSKIINSAMGLAGQLSGPAWGGGSFWGGDAYGGSSSNPLPGLSADDYGPGFRQGGGVAGFADGGAPLFNDRWDASFPDLAGGKVPPPVLNDSANPFDPIHDPGPVATQEWRDANPLPGVAGGPAAVPDAAPVLAKSDPADDEGPDGGNLPLTAQPTAGLAPGTYADIPRYQTKDDDQRGFGIAGMLGLPEPSNAARAALIATGLGLLSSRSPNLGNALGDAGATGLATYAGVRKGEQDAQEKAAKLSQEADRIAKDIAIRTAAQQETARHNKATEAVGFKPTYGVIREEVDPGTGQMKKIYGWLDPNTRTAVAPAGPAPAADAPPALGAIDPHLSGPEYMTELEKRMPGYAGTVKAVGDYRQSITSLSRNAGYRERVLSDALRYNPDYDQTQFTGKSRAVSNFAGGPEGRTVRSLNVAIDHLGTLDEAAKAMQNGDLSVLNKVVNAYRKQTGSPLATNFDSIKQVVSAEIAKAVVGGQTALHDRDDMAQRANNSSSPAQLSGIVTEFKKLMAGQMKGLRKQYETSTRLKNFDDFLEPQTKAALDAVSSNGAHASASFTPPPGAVARSYKGKTYYYDPATKQPYAGQ